MLLDGFGFHDRGITEFQFCDLQGSPFDMEFCTLPSPAGLAMTVCSASLGFRVKSATLAPLAWLAPLLRRLRESAVEERDFGANGIGQGRICEPWNIVEVGGDARGFLDVIGYEDTGKLGWKLKLLLRIGRSDELVSGGLQIVAANLSARSQTGDSDNLSFGENFFALNVTLAAAKWQQVPESALMRGKMPEQQRAGMRRAKREKREASPYSNGNGADYSTVTDFARLRGWSTSQPRRTAM